MKQSAPRGSEAHANPPTQRFRGMLGGINLNASTSLATQLKLARQADYMLLPGEPFPSEEKYASMSKLAHTATVVSTVTATPTQAAPVSSAAADDHEDHSAGLSTGAVAGIAVGAAGAALIAAALIFLLCRTRSLKRKLEKQKAEAQPPIQPDPNVQSSTGYGNYYEQVRHPSQLPPYRPYPNGEPYSQDVNKDTWQVDQVPTRTMSPPMQQQQYTGSQSPDLNQRFG